jgi:hypothetical protein
MISEGVKAGVGGAVVMSVSTNLEMRLSGRDASDAPAKALERLFGIDLDNERAEQTLVLAAHVATSVSLGIVAAGLRRRLPPLLAASFLLGASLIPELIVVPSLGAAEPPWKWSRQGAAQAIVHHAVYAVATAAILERLMGRGLPPRPRS